MVLILVELLKGFLDICATWFIGLILNMLRLSRRIQRAQGRNSTARLRIAVFITVATSCRILTIPKKKR